MTPDLDRVRSVAGRLGFDALRDGQEDATRAVLDGRDTLAVMPTGPGKSAIYQIAGQLIGGPTLVISPLIGLRGPNRRERAAEPHEVARGHAR